MGSTRVFNNKIKRAIFLTLLYAIVWIATSLAVRSFFSYSPSKNVYGMISAWWAGLYFCNLFEVKLKDIGIFFVAGFLFFFFAFIIEKKSFDLVDIIEPQIIFISAPLANYLVMMAKKFVLKKLNSTRSN